MSTLKYLDDTGVALLWAKVKAAIAAKPDVNTTYTLQQSMVDGHQFSLIGSDSSTVTITIPDNGEENVIETVKVNGTALTPSNKAVDITVPDTTGLAPLASPALTGTPTAPTASTGTSTTQIATTAFVAAAIAAASIGIQFEIVQSLPASGSTNTIYLVPNSGTGTNIYDEYVWVIVDSSTTPVTYGWEKIGSTAVDLSGYVQFTDLVAITSQEIDQICV